MSGVIAELKAINYRWPDDAEANEGAEHFGVQAQIFIGSAGEDTFDSFDVLACSPGLAGGRSRGVLGSP